MAFSLFLVFAGFSPPRVECTIYEYKWVTAHPEYAYFEFYAFLRRFFIFVRFSLLFLDKSLLVVFRLASAILIQLEAGA